MEGLRVSSRCDEPLRERRVREPEGRSSLESGCEWAGVVESNGDEAMVDVQSVVRG